MVELFQKPPEPGADPAAPPEQKHGLFSKAAAPPPQDMTGVTKDVENAVSRVRVLEERFQNIRTELKLVEENAIRKNRNLGEETKTIHHSINDLRHDTNELKDRIMMLIKEIQGMAKREDVQVLKRYVEMWEPLNFVTHTELQEALGEHHADHHPPPEKNNKNKTLSK